MPNIKTIPENEINGIRDTINKVDLFGRYKGVIPIDRYCGKVISLTLRNDSTYQLEYKYLCKKEGAFLEEGTFRVLKEKVIEMYCISSNEKTYYAYVHGNLVQSDSLGYIKPTNFPEQYTLEKTS